VSSIRSIHGSRRNLIVTVAALALGSSSLQAATTIIQGEDEAVSIQADFAGQRIAVLTRHFTATGAPLRLLVLGLDGQPRAAYPLPDLDPQADGPWTPEAHLLPRAGKVLVATIPQYIYGPEPGIAGLVDLATGGVQRLDLPPTAVAADPARNRVFVASGDRLQILDPTSGATILDRHFAAPISQLVLSPSGKLDFILPCVAYTRYGECVNRFVSLSPPSYRVSKRVDFGNSDNPDASGGNWLALLGVDEARGRFYVGHTGFLYLEAIFMWVSLEPAGELVGQDLPHDQNIFGDGFEQDLLAFDGAASYVYIDSSAEDHYFGVYDAGTLRRVRTTQGFFDVKILGRDRGGKLLVARGPSLQRRDPRSLRRIQSVNVGGSAVLADIHPAQDLAYLVVETGSGQDRRQDLVRFDLESFQPLP
jgi:hypothetical protein